MSNDDAPVSSGTPSVELLGLAGSPGLALGRARVLTVAGSSFRRRHIRGHAADDELARYVHAVETAVEELRRVRDDGSKRLARSEASILEAYVLMLEDETLKDDVERAIRVDLQCAEWAVERVIAQFAAQLAKGADPYIRERSHDFEFVGQLLVRALIGKGQSIAAPALPTPGILVARDLSPADTLGLDKERVLALVTEVGTRTSHTAILARALEIPAVVGVAGLLAAVGEGDALVVDGMSGRVIVSPSPAQVAAASARAERHLAFARNLHEARDRPAASRCGVPLVIKANIELPSEAPIALYEGARGIGLYRTEFLYIDRDVPPSEDEQYEVYARVLEAIRPEPVTLRTFDIGGDKFVSSFNAPPEMNPALGLRAVRLALAHPELLLTQLRAMVRASVHGDLRIMVPMISGLQELLAVRDLLGRAIEQVDSRGHQRAEHIPLGIMVEVPSAAIMIDQLARHAEFLSIGTNDLTQYTLAVDRTNGDLSHLASPFDPALLRLIAGVVRAAQKHQRDLSVCGAMASDPLATMLLLGLGLRELSVEASAIPAVKEALSRATVAEAEAVVDEVMGLAMASEIQAVVEREFGQRFADLIELN